MNAYSFRNEIGTEGAQALAEYDRAGSRMYVRTT